MCGVKVMAYEGVGWFVFADGAVPMASVIAIRVRPRDGDMPAVATVWLGDGKEMVDFEPFIDEEGQLLP